MRAIDGSAAQSVSRCEKRGATSAMTTALRTIAPCSAARVSCCWDHEPQRASAVKTSSRTLLSTSVATAGLSDE
jgi:hypothetical protein